jgi:hypothetical protein
MPRLGKLRELAGPNVELLGTLSSDAFEGLISTLRPAVDSFLSAIAHHSMDQTPP